MNVEPPKVRLVKWSAFLASIGVNKTTGWKWRKSGKIVPTVNIDGRWYLRPADIEQFEKRATAGEFARTPRSPKSSRNSDMSHSWTGIRLAAYGAGKGGT